jgi:hypothetical protein
MNGAPNHAMHQSQTGDGELGCEYLASSAVAGHNHHDLERFLNLGEQL